MWGNENKEIDDLLHQHLLNYPPSASQEVGDTTLIQHVVQMPVTTPKEQFLCLSSISNYHSLPYPESHGTTHQLINPKGHLGYKQHLLHKPTGSHTNPTSLRNRLMFYLTKDESSVPWLLVKRYLKIDQEKIEIDSALDIHDEEVPLRPKKKRRHQNRIVTVTLKDISQETGQDYNSLLNCSNPDRPLYLKFKEEMRMEGGIKWRHHDRNSDVCIMTDYSATNGNIIPSSFVHVTRQYDVQGNNIISCTCEIYKHLQGIAYHQHRGEDNEELYPDTTMTCMHCRYFQDELDKAYTSLQNVNTNLPWALEQVHNSLQYMNDAIQLSGSVIEKGTTKFSVKGDDSTLTFVHITFQQNKCYAKCMGGICSVELQAKKKLPRLHAITETPNLCPHMKKIVQHIDHVKSFFPWHFNESNEILPATQMEEPVNTEDAGLVVSGGNFNKETGLWDYPAFSTHKPKTMMDQQLITATQIRDKFATSGKIQESSGLRIYNLKPRLRDQHGENRKCNCGGHYNEDGFEEKQESILYTRIAPLKCISYNLKCTSGQCEITFQEPAEEKGIFFYSPKTAVADEIGWDFVRAVKNMRTSFRGFCKEMSTRYETSHSPAYPFMSGNTFISYFFCWLSAMKIDFRKEIDPKCGYDPKILACDGTHIGVSTRNLNLEHSVTKRDYDTVLKSHHRRKQRALIPDADARIYLKYFCKKILKKLKDGKEKTPFEEQEMKEFIQYQVEKMNDDSLSRAINMFFNPQTEKKILLPFTKLLIMLSGDPPMSSVFPFRSHQVIRDTINSLVITKTLGPKIHELRKYSCELVHLFQAAIDTNCVGVIVSFVLQIILRIEHLHNTRNRPLPPIEEIPNSYDPTKGVAYYFTESGNQLRKMPGYEEVGGNKNYDDPPEVDAACTKNYPGVSYGGFGYILLWFCPIHGHSYGFHLIAGGEGRKDPFSSIFKYKPEAPKELFYDNACQLHEYCLNREPAFFLNIRFWHDLFHSIGHLCGCNYKSRRVLGLEALNTEICEQVNSFLQCIKYTGSHLSQDHFCFFIQFFLYLLNKEKTGKLQKLTTVAVAGHF